MSFNAYRATAFNHAHENHAFNQLHDLLQSHWAEQDEPLHLLGNFYIDGGEVDALIIKRNAIIVIDFKDYAGNLKFSENGRWLMDGKEVRGGNKTNPYHQIRDNKYQLLNYLKRYVSFQSSPNLGHIAGVCLFHQGVEFDAGTLPHNISRWFHIADISRAVRITDAIVSPEISLSNTDINAILTQLNVPLYYPDGRPEEVKFTPIDDEAKFLRGVVNESLNSEQQKALVAIKDWLLHSEQKVFSLGGAFCTGKIKLLKAATEHIVQQGKSPVYLAPNARIANLYKGHDFSDVKSVYSWLYAGMPSYMKNGKASYPVMLDAIDAENEVLVFLDSHLLGDDFFETDTTIYGSGFILQDLLNTLLGKLPECAGEQSLIELKVLPKILLAGDPYQLTRGARDRTLLSCQVFEKKKIQYSYVELNSQDRGNEAPVERLDFQKPLIEQLQARKFTQLPVCEQGTIKTIIKGEQTDSIAHSLLKWPRESVYLCAKNETAHGVNCSIRRKYLAASDDDLLVVGDIVDLHNRTPKLNAGSFGTGEIESINAGVFGRVVEVGSNVVTKSLTLKGRDRPLSLRFATATVEFAGSVSGIRYLPDFLAAPKPELTQDQIIALQVWAREAVEEQLGDERAALERLEFDNLAQYEAKAPLFTKKYNSLLMNSPYTNVARLRFGYSSTVHRAQSHEPLQKVVLNGSSAHDTENPATDSYFRWLYTASICTSDTLLILDYPELTPLSKTQWSSSSARLVPIAVKPTLYYSQDRVSTDDELAVPLPEGFSNPEPRLLALLLTIYDLIGESTWHIEGITQHNYRERYRFSCDDGALELDLDYNGKYEVSVGVVTVVSGAPELGNRIKQQLYTPPIFTDPNVETAVALFDSHIACKDWSIIASDEKNHKVFLIIEHQLGRVKVELNVPYIDSSISKNGVISSVKVQQADNADVIAQFEKDFMYG